MRKGRKREGREDGEGVGAAATGFYPPRGLARRASSLVGLPAASGLPRAPRWPGAHAQPGSPPERPAPQRRERARPASGCLATPGLPARAARLRSLGLLAVTEGRGHAGARLGAVR